MIAVAGGKGGCGKTTTALGLAGAIAEREPVTVLDADVDMPDLHVVTDVPSTPGVGALADGAPIAECRHRVIDEPGLSIVPAGDRAGSIDAALERLRRTDGPVVVDTPAGASVDVTRPIRFADRVVLVSTPTRESLVDAAKTAALARSVGTPIAGLVLNKSDGSIDPSPLLDCAVLAHVPTVADGRPRSVVRASYNAALKRFNKRNT